jgi:hypothetical protein
MPGAVRPMAQDVPRALILVSGHVSFDCVAVHQRGVAGQVGWVCSRASLLPTSLVHP